MFNLLMAQELQDPRYPTIKPMFDQGRIKSLTDIFIYIPKSVLAEDMGKNLKRFNQQLHNPENFSIKDLIIIGNLCGLSRMEMFHLLNAEFDIRDQAKQKYNRNVSS